LRIFAQKYRTIDVSISTVDLTGTYQGRDCCCDNSRFLVLPHAYNCPAFAFKSVVGIEVASAIPCDLLEPVFRVRTGARATVLRTAMPEAAVDVHRHTSRPEHNVCAASERSQRGTVHTVPKAVGVKQTAEAQFGCRVPRPL
jgi:hypothetical protein